MRLLCKQNYIFDNMSFLTFFIRKLLIGIQPFQNCVINNRVTLKTGVMMLKMQHCTTIINYILKYSKIENSNHINYFFQKTKQILIMPNVCMVVQFTCSILSINYLYVVKKIQESHMVLNISCRM